MTNANKFYTLDEVLPHLPKNTRASAVSVGSDYIIGVDGKSDFLPITISEYPDEADAIVADLQRAVDEYFGVDNSAGFDEDESALLEGFTFVPNKGMAQILVGKRNRLYLKGDITTLLDITPRSRVLIAFNPVDKAFAIVKPSAPVVTEEMSAAGYFVSKRKDVTCAKLFREFALDKYEGKTFYADKSSLSGNVVVFKR